MCETYGSSNWKRAYTNYSNFIEIKFLIYVKLRQNCLLKVICSWLYENQDKNVYNIHIVKVFLLLIIQNKHTVILQLT